ncbi:UDP-2,3-diacylglucosamine diphosphatase LpxI [bacterium]|nr:UDP-2,3-diacylglucosamine diphosphatase LpxI [bacterium]MCP5462796.1 UDP-2,3-diacylglucosamine diphosphatase LpxI [bacterium]
MKKILGIVAGEGSLPFIVAQNARRNSVTKICGIGFKGQTNPAFEECADEFLWIGLGQLGRLIKFFKKNDVSEAVFIGRICHNIVFTDLKLDFKMLQVATKIRDWRADSILSAIAGAIEAENITILPSTQYLQELLPVPGVLTKHQISRQQKDDISFGFFVAKHLAAIDAGQTVVVKKKTVLALEAIEGTDAAILRGGMLGKKDSVVVKVSKPNQDMRFDVPVIGLTTIRKLKEANVSLLAFEANKTLLVDREDVIKEAEKNNIAIVSVNPDTLDLSDFLRSI